MNELMEFKTEIRTEIKDMKHDINELREEVRKLKEIIETFIAQFKIFGKPPQVLTAFFAGSIASMVGLYYIVQQIVHLLRFK